MIRLQAFKKTASFGGKPIGGVLNNKVRHVGGPASKTNAEDLKRKISDILNS